MTEKNGLGSEELEGRGQETEDARNLEDATLEPSACVEETGSYQESEAIEASVTDLVETGGTGTGESQVSKIDSFTRDTEDGLEQDIGATPLPIPNEPKVLDKEQDLGATPLPIPYEADEIEYVKISPEKPSDLPLEISGEELMLDGKGNDALINPDISEEIGYKFFREADQPTEMPPELSEDEISRKRPGKEDVEFKFFKPIPAEEDPTSEVGKISGPNPKIEEEESKDIEEDPGRGA